MVLDRQLGILKRLTHMLDFSELLQQGTGSAWLFFPTAVLLGALHGLEPGHSKTMIAAFIIAVCGTIPQAILLGLSAMISHTAIIWILAIAVLTWGEEVIGENAEPLLMFISGLTVMVLAIWMFLQTRRSALRAESRSNVTALAFAGAGGRLVGASVQRAHDHAHNHHHGHDHHHGGIDSHQRAHAAQIEGRFAGGSASNTQVILFGLSGGLLPCSAAVAVLLLCLQIGQYGLGLAMVGAFSLGLAIALVGVGVIAAWGVKHASRRFNKFDQIARRLPCLSSVIIFGIGVLMMLSGWHHLGGPHH